MSILYRIGICDDEIDTCNQLEYHIQKYLNEVYIECKIEIFYSGESLCQHLKNNEDFNLVFLDIELPQINGIQVGSFIRNILQDEITDIVYISSKTNYALELFSNRPLDFIVKPISFEKIKIVLDLAVKRNGIRDRYFEFPYSRSVRKVPLQQIMYFKSDNKKIHIILQSGEEVIFNGKLVEVQKTLPELFFLQIHKSYLINYNYVSEYNYNWVKMINGDILNISKSHRKEVTVKLIKHEMQ